MCVCERACARARVCVCCDVFVVCEGGCCVCSVCVVGGMLWCVRCGVMLEVLSVVGVVCLWFVWCECAVCVCVCVIIDRILYSAALC